MPTAPIIFSGSEDKTSSQLGGGQNLVVNAMPDAGGTVRRRPGIAAWDMFPSSDASGSPVIGMHPFKEFLVYVTADRRIHAKTAQGGLEELSDLDDTDTLLDGAGRPSFVEGREMMVIAGGGAMQKWTGSGLSARLENTGVGGDPPSASFICAISQRLVAQVNNDSGQVWWTGPLEEYENWDMSTGGASYIQAAAKPDRLVALFDNTNEFYAFGEKTIQVYAPSGAQIDANDANNILDFAPARTGNYGTISPYSIIPTDDTFYLIDSRKRIIETDGRTYNDVSAKVTAILNEVNVETAIGFRMRFGRFDACVWIFPDDGYGLLYDRVMQRWCEWRAWDMGEKAVSITSAYHWTEKSLFLLGLADGTIARLDDTVWTDLGDPIPVELITGFSSHASGLRKQCKRVTVQMRRDQANSASSGHVRLYRRFNEGSWKVTSDIELGASKETMIEKRSLGLYRTNQWRLRYTGSDELQIVWAEEEFEISEDT